MLNGRIIPAKDTILCPASKYFCVCTPFPSQRRCRKPAGCHRLTLPPDKATDKCAVQLFLSHPNEPRHQRWVAALLVGISAQGLRPPEMEHRCESLSSHRRKKGPCTSTSLPGSVTSLSLPRWLELQGAQEDPKPTLLVQGKEDIHLFLSLTSVVFLICKSAPVACLFQIPQWLPTG